MGGKKGQKKREKHSREGGRERKERLNEMWQRKELNQETETSQKIQGKR